MAIRREQKSCPSPSTRTDPLSTNRNSNLIGSGRASQRATYAGVGNQAIVRQER
jgi:hypothetical protein